MTSVEADSERSPVLVEAGRLVVGLGVLAGEAVRTVGGRVSGTTEPGASLVPAGERGVLRTLPTAALGLGAAAMSTGVRVVERTRSTTGTVARGTGIDRIVGAARTRALRALRPWYERGLREREASRALAGTVVREGMGAATEGIVGTIDVETVMSKVDFDSVIEQLQVSNIVFQTTGGIAADAVDFARGRAVAVDALVNRAVGRVLRRSPEPGALPGVTPES